MEQQTPANEPFVIERTYTAPIGKVWDAITDKDKMKQWYFDLSDFKLEVGFDFKFSAGTATKTYLHLCSITQIVPGKLLAYSWAYDGYPGSSEVTWELFDEGDKTRLKLTHTGLHTFRLGDDFAPDNFIKGWTHIVGTSLMNYLQQA